MKETIEVLCDAEIAEEIEGIASQHALVNKSQRSVKASGNWGGKLKEVCSLFAGSIGSIIRFIQSLQTSKRFAKVEIQSGKAQEERLVVTDQTANKQIEYIVTTKSSVRIRVVSKKE